MCKIIYILVLSLLGLNGVCQGQFIQDGQCEDLQSEDFRLIPDSFAGTWYEYSRIPYPGAKDCSTITIERDGTGWSVYYQRAEDNIFEEFNGTASFYGDSGILILLPGISDNPLNFWVLTSNFQHYALAYLCENVGTTQRRYYVWQLGKEEEYLSQFMLVWMNGSLRRTFGIESSDLTFVDNSEKACTRLPVIPHREPIILPGECDGNVNGVQNFNTGEFLGIWHVISNYFSENALGTCSRAEYISPDGINVDVVNSQVINRRLFTTEGNATILSDEDGRGRLEVLLEVSPGEFSTFELTIVATDYRQWAITYLCQNLPNNQRRVYSTILSRTRALPDAAQLEVQAIIRIFVDLNNIYYEPIDQSTEACVYTPTPAFDRPVVYEGQCDDSIPVLQNFNVEAYLGMWYSIEAYPSRFQTGTCNNAYYSIGSGGVNIFNRQVIDETLRTISGVAEQVGTEAKLIATFPVEGTNFTTESDYWIIATDYTSYSLVYSCSNINNFQKQINMWKLSRTRSLTAAANIAINTALATQDIFDQQYFHPNDQSREACFYYPNLEPGEEVIFPGRCEDQNIPVVENFNANLYLGKWIEIERYQQRDQFGTCDRAYYSPGEGNVLVRNTQVVNETLAEQLGYAVLGSNDGEGLLDVTFEVQGNTVYAKYYVVATDYDNYALVYSCRDLNDGNMQVFSWKLSRQATLSTSSVEAINAAIALTPGLSQQYYIPTSQTDEDCFYVPQLDANAAPIFRGQCEENISGVGGFDAARYAGWWHEIERYPVDNNRGECISSQYQGSGVNTYRVVDTVVSGNMSYVDRGTVQVTSNGRLTRTINDKVEVIWVLATDYETYSLLYSCENTDEENSHRRVWSAKHSKTRSLTSAAQAAMAPVIEANKVLSPQLYLPVDQSDEACFHYPELTSQQVILRGQCDPNIPVVTDFNIGAYGGTWYQIERYPQRYENSNSTCIGARYTLLSPSRVSVQNWEIINGELVTIEGVAALASSDGSAKLEVVLPVVGSPTGAQSVRNLYVLATDYESYSLVYSCSNINDFQRTVGAWKLSRRRTMSDAGTAIIETYMANRDELHQPYFIEVEQNDQCRQPSSGTFLRSSIVVMLICAVWQMLS